MTRKLTARGRHTVLPIIGDTVAEIRFGFQDCPEIVFRGADGHESIITIPRRFVLGCGHDERVFDWSQSVSAWKPEEPHDFVQLLGTTMTDAVAEQFGRLMLSFSDKSCLKVDPREYEGWRFQSPRPGRPLSSPAPYISIGGEDGRLV